MFDGENQYSGSAVNKSVVIARSLHISGAVPCFVSTEIRETIDLMKLKFDECVCFFACLFVVLFFFRENLV